MAGTWAATWSSGAALRMNASAASMCVMTRSIWTEFANLAPIRSPRSSSAVTCAASRCMRARFAALALVSWCSYQLVDVVVELLDPRQRMLSPGRVRLPERAGSKCVAGRSASSALRSRSGSSVGRARRVGSCWLRAWLRPTVLLGREVGLGPLPRQPPAPRWSEGLFWAWKKVCRAVPTEARTYMQDRYLDCVSYMDQPEPFSRSSPFDRMSQICGVVSRSR